MNELCLYAGAGGGLLAGKHLLGWRSICYVEIDRYCQEIIKARIRDGYLDDAPIWDDIRTFDGRAWRGLVDIISAGFPCQPFSVAGKQEGESDERNMWPDTIRIIREVRPRYVFLENVPGLLVSGYFGTILGDLAESGYNARWRVLSAAEVGAPHKRDRLWIVGYASSSGCEARDAHSMGDKKQKAFLSITCSSNVADTDKKRLSFRQKNREWSCKKEKVKTGDSVTRNSWWDTEPNVGRVAHGVPSRVDRLKALGNGQVPLVAAKAWEILTEDL